MGHASVTTQFFLIFGKHRKLAMRQKKAFCMELLIPPVVMLLLVAIYGIVSSTAPPDMAFACNLCDDDGVNCMSASESCHDYNTAYEDIGFSAFQVSEDNDCDLSPGLSMTRILSLVDEWEGTLAVAPDASTNDNAVTMATGFTNYLQTTYPDYSDSVFQFTDQKTMDNYITGSTYEDVGSDYGKIYLAVVFQESDIVNHQYDYAVRANNSAYWLTNCFVTGDDDNQRPHNGRCLGVPDTDETLDNLEVVPYPSYIQGYGSSGFLTLQSVVDRYIVSLSDADVEDVAVNFGMMPKAAYTTNDFESVISDYLGLLMTLAFMFPVSRWIRALVIEKETRAREGMRMMGMRDSVMFSSWFLWTWIQQFFCAVLIVIFTGTTVFKYSSDSVILLYFWVYMISISSLAFLIHTFFSRSKSAATLGTMGFFVSFFPFYAVSDPSYSTMTKTFASLLSPLAFALGSTTIADYEGGQVGMHWSNYSEQTSNYSMETCMIMMIFDSALYIMLALYVDKVMPSEFGTQLVWYFPFTKSYWFGTPEEEDSLAHKTNAKDKADIERALIQNQPEDADAVDEEMLERVPAELRQQEDDNRCVTIQGLRKVYKTTAEDKVAVKYLKMSMYSDQITVLLGHNGAGKSTTISMLTGLIPPTSGDAMVLGRAISQEMKDIRSTLGVCPQHDILFDQLTVYEHLEFFAGVKGVPPSEIKDAVTKMIAEVGLTEKRNVWASALSGGMKRKLSVGIALIGDSKVIVLDEPTSGMDPYSRRSTWSVLQRNKKGRVILLTTHFMDEADILGDRIAIMAEGQLRCCGSSLFLKNKYGVGYTMTVVRSDQGGGGNALNEIVSRHVPETTTLSNVGAEQQFRLPLASSPAFPDLFDEIDSRKAELHVAEYGISVTTLEEVFLRVAHGDDNPREKEETSAHARRLSQWRSESSSNANEDIPKDPRDTWATNESGVELGYANPQKTQFWSAGAGRVSERRVFFAHFKALLRKRFIYAKRDSKAICFQLIIPVLLVIAGFGLLEIVPSTIQYSLELTPLDWNTGLSINERNYVPFNAGSAGADIYDQFTFDNLNAEAVPVTTVADQFAGCALGSDDSLALSDSLLAPTAAELLAEHGSSRYGAITFNSSTEYTVLANYTAIHSAPVMMNLVNEARVQLAAGDNSASIVIRNYPLPQTALQDLISNGLDTLIASFFMIIAFSFIPASFAIFVVKEREVKAKHQQIISGVSLYAYWVATFVWDSVSALMPGFLSILLIFIFGLDAYTSGEALGATILLFMFFGPAAAGFTYIQSFAFKSHSSAQNLILGFNFLSGLFLMIASFVMGSIDSTKDINSKLKYFYRLFPTFCFADGIAILSYCSDDQCFKGDGSGEKANPLNWQVAGADIFFLGVSALVYLFITFGIEYALSFPWIVAMLQRTSDPGDVPDAVEDDVQAEAQRVQTGGASDDIVRLEGLRKVYPGGKVAVRQLSFGIPRGECFGFLGINGAGKTTTLSILSGEFPPTAGTAYIGGFDIQSDQTKIRRQIGYCPQFDALLELLTVQEHLEMYARIKGVPEDRMNRIVASKIQEMDLGNFANKAAGTLSGGNKRKLSVAIAMIGEPSIVFLDEPSTGMDPVARRFMWDVISKLSTQDGRCSIILTTHNMEEAEALCTRIGIMVNGGLQCLGSSQHLKTKYGSGYEVDIKTDLASDAEHDAMHADLVSRGLIEAESRSMNEAAVISACSALGRTERAQLLTHDASGFTIRERLDVDGSVRVHTFVEWWISEDISDSLEEFIMRTFAGAVRVEHASATSYRYQVPSDTCGLGQMFRLFEAEKAALRITEYSVGQSSLDAIFNRFASGQANPENRP